MDDQLKNIAVTPGEAWVKNRNGNRQSDKFGLGTDEVLERWRAGSIASHERRASRQPQAHGFQQQRESGTYSMGSQNFGEQIQEHHWSITQSHEVGLDDIRTRRHHPEVNDK